MKSTSGLSIWPRNCLAYADNDSTYRRWPSAKMVSKARLDLPDPDSPVKTIRESLGRSSETSLRLCSRAPRTTRRSATALRFPRSTRLFEGLGGRVAMLSGGSDKNWGSWSCRVAPGPAGTTRCRSATRPPGWLTSTIEGRRRFRRRAAGSSGRVRAGGPAGVQAKNNNPAYAERERRGGPRACPFSSGALPGGVPLGLAPPRGQDAGILLAEVAARRRVKQRIGSVAAADM